MNLFTIFFTLKIIRFETKYKFLFISNRNLIRNTNFISNFESTINLIITIITINQISRLFFDVVRMFSIFSLI